LNDELRDAVFNACLKFVGQLSDIEIAEELVNIAVEHFNWDHP